MQTTDNATKMQASFTPHLLAENLGIGYETLKRAMTRMDFYYGKDDALPVDVVRDIVTTYATPHPRRPDEVVESAQEIAQQFNIQININNNSTNLKVGKEPPAATPEPAQIEQAGRAGLPPNPVAKTKLPAPKPKPGQPIRQPELNPGLATEPDAGNRNPFVTILVYLAFVFILLFQMEHVASIGMDVSALDNHTARQVSGWLFAFTFNLTALLMTLRRGISAVIHFGEKKVSYILLFAILDVVFFVMSAAPMGSLGQGFLMWGKAILVGSATAFVIYSFNELLSANK